MISKKIVGFGFKGNRSYVHGSDIYPAALKFIHEIIGCYPDEVNASFHKFLKRQGVFSLCIGEEKETFEEIYARFIFKFGEIKQDLVLNTTNIPINNTRPYDEEDVLRYSKTRDRSISMQNRPEYSYIEQIIAMTKSLHKSVYPDVHDKWLFTKLHIKDRIDPNDYSGTLLTVQAERKIQNILSQCSIAVDSQPVGHIYFSAIRDGMQS